MSTYLIGDVHGCYDELIMLLAQVNFNPIVDQLWLTGDLVARGPHSLKVLKLVHNLGDSVRMVLGNHDLHLMALYAGIHCNKLKDGSITQLLEAPEADELINWLRRQPVLQIAEEKQLVMTHAGITPQWDIATAMNCAREVEEMLQSDNYRLLLDAMYGDMPNNWSKNLTGLARLRFSTNVFTRMRYCLPNGQLEMTYKNRPEIAPGPLHPWFSLRRTKDESYSIVFGHWSSLNGEGTPPNIYGLDTSCCWGGKLTLLRWEDKKFISVPSKK